MEGKNLCNSKCSSKTRSAECIELIFQLDIKEKGTIILLRE